MLKNRFLYGAAILGLGLTACSSDEPAVNGTTADRDMTRYLKVAICTASSGTRAATSPDQDPDGSNNDDFQSGSQTESNVNDMIFAFYDQSGNFIQTAEAEEKGTWTAPDPDHLSVELQQTAYVPVSLNKGDNMPAYVICFINADATLEKNIEGVAMENLRNVVSPTLTDGNGNFMMNNSVYYGNDPYKGDNVKVSGTPITIDKLYPTKQAAMDDAAATVDIYVERFASRLTYDLANNAIKTVTIKDDNNKEYTLSFAAQAWGVNADAPDMYVVKKFALATDDAVPTFDQVNTNLSYFVWNQEDYFRSYWACSPNYYSSTFPSVSDNVKDAWQDAGNTGTGAGDVTSYNLKYYSYNQISEKNRAVNTSDYFMENTMGLNAFNSRNPLAAAPSAVLIGQYSIDSANKTFYTIGSGDSRRIYFANETDGPTLKKHFVNAQSTIFTLENGKYVPVRDEDIFLIQHPSETVYSYNPGATTKNRRDVAEWFVTLQLDYNKVTGGTYFVKTDFGTYADITTANLTQADFLLWEDVKNASAYTDGKAYFSLPIKHLGAFVANALGIKTENGQEVITWSDVRPGEFGLVRNHAYTINVSSITGLGIGILDPAMPIVPPTKQDQYWFKYRINIQKWRIVPTQNATFN